MNRYDNLPDHWREWIRKYALKISNGKYDELGATAFRGKVKLLFEDGSYCFFEHAFYVEDEEKEELLLLTEHCGYHVFTLAGLGYEYYEWTEPRIRKTDAEQ